MLEQCWANQRPLPKAIQNAPDLLLGLEFVYFAFWELSSCRPVGFSAGPIPWSIIVDFARSHGLSLDEEEDFIYHIRALDHAFLEYSKEQSEKTKPSARQKKIGG